MEQEVYVDLYILVNTSMDLLCLMISAAFLHLKVLRRRVILGAGIGGFYALAVLFLGLDGVIGVLADLAAAVGICAVAFKKRKTGIRQLLKLSVVYAFTSMLLGGIMTALFSWLNRLELPLESLQGDGLSVWMFAILAAVAGIFTVNGGRFFGRSQKTRSVTVEAVLFGRSVTLLAMVDSGNLLRDPVSGRSVIVAEREALEAVLPPNFFQRDQWVGDHELVRKLRMIPTQTATGSGMLTAILPDSLTVTDSGGTVSCDYLIAPTELGGRAQGFDALIPLE